MLLYTDVLVLFLRFSISKLNGGLCDDSLQDTLCGCAVWCASFSLQAKLPTDTSIFTAELYAIVCAATYVSTLPSHFLILTDSQFCNCVHHPSSHYLVPKISSLLSGLPPSKVLVQWVPSHGGISGNKLADDMAKGSLRLSYTTQNPFSAALFSCPFSAASLRRHCLTLQRLFGAYCYM